MSHGNILQAPAPLASTSRRKAASGFNSPENSLNPLPAGTGIGLGNIWSGRGKFRLLAGGHKMGSRLKIGHLILLFALAAAPFAGTFDVVLSR